VNLAVSGKADAVLFNIKDPAGQVDTISRAVESVQEVTWGVRLPRADVEGINGLKAAGCDFVMIDPEAAACVLQEEDMGKVLEVGMSCDDGLLRAVSQLAVDALLPTEDKQSGLLTIHQLLDYHRLIGFAGKPSLATLPRELADLAALRDAGIKGVVMELAGKDAQIRLDEVRKSIDKLPRSKKQKSKGASPALVPSTPSVDEIEDEY